MNSPMFIHMFIWMKHFHSSKQLVIIKKIYLTPIITGAGGVVRYLTYMLCQSRFHNIITINIFIYYNLFNQLIKQK